MKTLIIGGGLSGLALAERLEAEGEEYLLVEARARFGGRIETAHHAGAAYDVGPAWFWPGQPRIAALIERLKLSRFDQHIEGDQLFETEAVQVQRGRSYAVMPQSWRLQGGLSALTDALEMALADGRKRLNAPVHKLKNNENTITATLQSGEAFTADRVVLALPPRVAAGLAFHPALPSPTLSSMRGVATWMAGQAKAVALYDTAFWRAAGLSGDASSRFGPLVEIHDASPATGGPAALFGFIGVPPEGRQDTDRLRQNITDQLVRMFGPKAADPRKLIIKDWAFDPQTATQADHAPLYAHPRYGLPPELTGLWQDRLLFAGTEVAPQFGGYLEGALEAAENVLGRLNHQKTNPPHAE